MNALDEVLQPPVLVGIVDDDLGDVLSEHVAGAAEHDVELGVEESGARWAVFCALRWRPRS
jgi:hypothetical protein